MDETAVIPDMNGTGTKTELKTRRPHRKSRYGCTKCKERRVKCDELLPKCSRCQKTNLVCHYPKRQPNLVSASGDDYWLEPIDPLLLALEASSCGRTDGGASSPESSGQSASGISRSPLPSSLYALSLNPGRRLDSPLRSQVAQTLAPAEFDLLKHYLEHTSKDVTVDAEDQYTLQVGIPNLACQSKPLMRSVLALSAICRCCDIINQSQSVSLEGRAKVREYLALAEQYHLQSIQEIRVMFPDAKHSDHVLANAAMMGMYGSGSHFTRIWLTKTAAFGDQSLYNYLPKSTEWISLWRAVDLAYMGMLDETDELVQQRQWNNTVHTAPEFMPAGSNRQYEYKVTSRVEPPMSAPTNHPLYPILAATAGSAFAKLRETAREISLIHASSSELANVLGDNPHYDTGTPPTIYRSTSPTDPALQSCFTALNILTNIISEVFPAKHDRESTTSYSNGSGSGSTTPSQLTFEVDIDPSGRLSEVSPWLRRYAGKITSLVPSKVPRRMMASFVHKVPTTYLNLVTDMLSLINNNNTATTGAAANDLDLDLDLDLDMSSMDLPPSSTWGDRCSYTHSHQTSETNHSCATTPSNLSCTDATPTLPHQLALEIFSHWLVLMVMLDNVWWIGDIGTWELARVVSFRRTMQQHQRQRQSGGSGMGSIMYIWSKEEDWWPESMYEVSRQFEKHRTRGGGGSG